MLRLKSYIWPYRGKIALATLLALPLSALRMSPAPLIKYLVDDLLVKKDASKLWVFPILMILIYVLNFFVRFWHYYLLRVATAKINQDIKNDLFSHLMGLSADYFSSNSVGNLISRVSHDPQYVDGGLQCINIVIREPITFILLLGYAFNLNWKLTLLTLTIFPMLAWVFNISAKHFKRYTYGMADEHGKLVSALQESFSGFRIVQSFVLTRYIEEKFRRYTSDFTRFVLKSARLEEVSHPLIELVTSFAIALVIYFGSLFVLKGQMTSGDLLAFFTTFGLMIDPVRKLNDVNIRVNQASSAAGRIMEIFSWKSRLVENPNAPDIHEFMDKVEFKKVRFAYPDSPEREVLKGLDLELRRGEIIALVGPSGSGKSSLVNLLPRVFDPTEGHILIDGKDIRNLRVESLRGLISVVSQDVFLFNDTIEENIRCGKRGATHEEIVEAARKANAVGFIQSLPEGFQTRIGDRGMKLSGGEKQRVSIARAFLRESPILILDEATSNLDNASEKLVQESIYELMKHRSTIMIAHRLSTVQRCDRILVIKDGHLVESGRHEELMDRRGEYYLLYEISTRE